MSREIVSLRSGGFVVEIAPSAGSSISRYAFDGGDPSMELLRPASPEALETATPTDMACFPLVPFSNRVRDGRFKFGGREVQLDPNFPPEPHTIHGHGWQTSWDIEGQSDSSLTTGFTHEAEAWPWPYRARQHYELSPEALEVTISVTNLGEEPMPAGVGLHPYFVRTAGARLETDVDKVWLNDDDSMPSELVPVPSGWDLKRLDPNSVSLDNNFTGWSGTGVIEWQDRNARLTMTADDLFAFLVVFTPAGEDFFCAEPVSNSIDAFNLADQGRTDVGGSVVDPGETLAGRIRFAPEVNA